MKIIYENCGVKNYMEEDYRSYGRNFCSCEKKASRLNFFRLSFRNCTERKSLKSHWIGKITTQQAKTSKVNTVSCILLNILASIYLLESFT